MDFYQTNASAGNAVRRAETDTLNIAKEVLETSPGVYPQLQVGDVLTIDAATGKFKLKTAVDEPAVGVVIVPNSTRNEQRVTVRSLFMAELRASSAAGCAVGDLVWANGTNATTGLPEFTTGSTGNLVDGLCTEVITANGEGRVLIYRSPIVVPAAGV